MRFAKSKVSILAAVALAAVAGGAASARASLIISDAFNGTSGATLSGRPPDGVDLPGTTYSANDYDGAVPFIATTNGNPSPAVNTSSLGAAAIELSHGSYTAPTSFSISADLSPYTTTPDVSGIKYARGAGLGFFTGALSASAITPTGDAFTGITVDTNGDLQLVVNGTAATPIAGTAPATFVETNFYNLSYTVNTTTGTISNVIYAGTNYSTDFSTATGFTAAATAYAGFYGSSSTSYSTSKTNAFVDNFKVSTVPEPATVGLVGLGGAMLLLRRKRKLA